MLTIAIQAGGKSRRMGQDKALVPLAGKTLIEHVIDRVNGLGDEILITANRPQDYAYLGHRIVSDPIPGLGALVGLQTALNEAEGDLVMVFACDMPFVNPELLKYMINYGPRADAVVPKVDGHYEPLHAIYKRSRCLPKINMIVSQGKRSILDLFPLLNVFEVGTPEIEQIDPDGLSFFNINTPTDLARAESLLANKNQL
jgi:molybdopterin-guanine dinucleotide biosynthesis protein A